MKKISFGNEIELQSEKKSERQDDSSIKAVKWKRLMENNEEIVRITRKNIMVASIEVLNETFSLMQLTCFC